VQRNGGGAMKIRPKNWNQFQHYKNRNPPWIKLHKSLLDNYEWFCLPLASRALAPCIWLLASEHQDGLISLSERELCFRLRCSEKELKEAIKPLIEKGFIIDDSGVLATCLQDATPETETETEVETEKNISSKSNFRSASLAEFDQFWAEYPRKEGKGAAEKAWEKASKLAEAETIFADLRGRQWNPDPKFIPLPATYLNQRRWEDEQPTPRLTMAQELARKAAECPSEEFQLLPYRRS
jgi:hypothetical protein